MITNDKQIMSIKNNFSGLKKTHRNIKEFNYALGKMTLNLSIDVDNKKDLSDILQCLNGAVKEIGEELENHR